jgi:hypothetical protein
MTLFIILKHFEPDMGKKQSHFRGAKPWNNGTSHMRQTSSIHEQPTCKIIHSEEDTAGPSQTYTGPLDTVITPLQSLQSLQTREFSTSSRAERFREENPGNWQPAMSHQDKEQQKHQDRAAERAQARDKTAQKEADKDALKEKNRELTRRSAQKARALRAAEQEATVAALTPELSRSFKVVCPNKTCPQYLTDIPLGNNVTMIDCIICLTPCVIAIPHEEELPAYCGDQFSLVVYWHEIVLTTVPPIQMPPDQFTFMSQGHQMFEYGLRVCMNSSTDGLCRNTLLHGHKFCQTCGAQWPIM